jgi:Uma2 family endonuclease
VLVEKAMGFLESQLAMTLGHLILGFVQPRRLGIVTGEQGMIRPLPDQVRMPDVAFYRQDKFPNGTPLEPVPELAPDLAIEVISPSNTAGEMERKRRDLFQAGMRLFWETNPRSRTAVVWTAVDQSTSLTEHDSLDGGDVLPGFTVQLADLFAEFQSK